MRMDNNQALGPGEAPQGRVIHTQQSAQTSAQLWSAEGRVSWENPS